MDTLMLTLGLTAISVSAASGVLSAVNARWLRREAKANNRYLMP